MLRIWSTRCALRTGPVAPGALQELMRRGDPMMKCLLLLNLCGTLALGVGVVSRPQPDEPADAAQDRAVSSFDVIEAREVVVRNKAGAAGFKLSCAGDVPQFTMVDAEGRDRLRMTLRPEGDESVIELLPSSTQAKLVLLVDGTKARLECYGKDARPRAGMGCGAEEAAFVVLNAPGFEATARLDATADGSAALSLARSARGNLIQLACTAKNEVYGSLTARNTRRVYFGVDQSPHDRDQDIATVGTMGLEGEVTAMLRDWGSRGMLTVMGADAASSMTLAETVDSKDVGLTLRHKNEVRGEMVLDAAGEPRIVLSDNVGRPTVELPRK